MGWLLWLTPLLFSCESDEILSLPQEPGDQNLNLYFTEIPLSYSLVQRDSVFTGRRANSSDYHLLVGNYRNQNFGRIEAQAFTELNLDTRTEVTAEDEFDSLVLVLVNDYFYGEADQVSSQTIGIYPLADTLARKTYYSSDKAAYLNTPLAEFSFIPDPEVNSSADTLRISLDATFGQELLDLAKADAAALSSDSAFREYFPGVVLTSLSENDFITGFDPAQMRLALYFSTTSETTSTAYTFDINPSVNFNNISADRSGTPLASVTTVNEAAMAEDGRFYLQSATGLIPTLSLQPVVDFFAAIEDSTDAQLRINRIDLYIGTTPLGSGQELPEIISALNFEDDFSLKLDTVTDNFGRPVSLAPRSLRIDNIQPREGVSPILTSEGKYQAQITQHIQGLLDEIPTIEPEFLIEPIDPGSNRPLASLNPIVAEPDSVFVKIYYTLLE